jgi:hypothetical protein
MPLPLQGIILAPRQLDWCGDATLEKSYLFHKISDEDNFYMKIVALEKIYNSLVFSLLI